MLSFYGMIPEAIFTTTSVSTIRTMTYQTSVGDFYYYTIKPELYFGYKFIPFGRDEAGTSDCQIRIAELEKGLLDFFYLRKQYNTEKGMTHLRLDDRVIRHDLDMNKMEDYLSRFKNNALEKRIKTLQSQIVYGRDM